jgi:hypothetical protein
MARDAQIQVRRDTAANWTSVNPILAAGEFGLETDTGFTKLGDGSSSWTSLRYTVRQPKVEIFTPIGARDIYYKYLSSSVATLTTLSPHNFQVGDNCIVAINDTVFDNGYSGGTAYTVASVTTYSFSYVKNATNTASTAVSPLGQAIKPQYWTKDPNAKVIEMKGMAAGGGGGSGRRGNITSNRGGGSGAPGGNYSEYRFLASDIPPGTFTGSALYVGVGFGGPPGLSITTDDTNGQNGGIGQGLSANGGITRGVSTNFDGTIWAFGNSRGGAVTGAIGSYGGLTSDTSTPTNAGGSFNVMSGGTGATGTLGGGGGNATNPSYQSGGGAGGGATAASAAINFINVTAASVASVQYVAAHNINTTAVTNMILKIENSASPTYNASWTVSTIPNTTSLTINNFTGGTGSATGGVATIIRSPGSQGGQSIGTRTLNPSAAQWNLGGFAANTPNSNNINASSTYAASNFYVQSAVVGAPGGGGGYATGSAGGFGSNAFNYGCGGGGGGASDNGFPSGSGGYGGNACIVIISYY